MSGNYEFGYQATVDLAKWMEEARRLKSLYVRAGWQVPPPLAAVLGETTDANQTASSRHTDTTSSRLAEDERIKIPVQAASTSSMAMAVLREAVRPLTASEIVKQIRAYDGHENVIDGTVMNLLSRKLATNEVNRDGNRWFLLDSESAPEVRDGELIAHPSQLQKQEVAAYRRQLILDLLQSHQLGLSQSEMIAKLKRMKCQGPVNKDTLKLDVTSLRDEGLIRRIPGSHKWVLKGGAA